MLEWTSCLLLLQHNPVDRYLRDSFDWVLVHRPWKPLEVVQPLLGGYEVSTIIRFIEPDTYKSHKVYSMSFVGYSRNYVEKNLPY